MTDEQKARADLESALHAYRRVWEKSKDCRTCQRYVHAQCALPDGHSGCSNMSAYVPTQPVRLWEK